MKLLPFNIQASRAALAKPAVPTNGFISPAVPIPPESKPFLSADRKAATLHTASHIQNLLWRLNTQFDTAAAQKDMNSSRDPALFLLRLKSFNEQYIAQHHRLNPAIPKAVKAAILKDLWDKRHITYSGFRQSLNTYGLTHLAAQLSPDTFDQAMRHIVQDISHIPIPELGHKLAVMLYNGFAVQTAGIRRINSPDIQSSETTYSLPVPSEGRESGGINPIKTGPKIVFFRHAKTLANQLHMFQGPSDFPVNQVDHHQNAHLAYAHSVSAQIALDPKQPVLLVTSSLARARESALLVQAQLQQRHPEARFQQVEHPYMTEFDWGSLNNKPPEHYTLEEALRSYLVYDLGNPLVNYLSGENIVDCMSRNLLALKGLQKLANHQPEKTIVIVGHAFQGAVIQSLQQPHSLPFNPLAFSVKNGQVLQLPAA